MDFDPRAVIHTIGIVFWVGFAAMTAYVIAEAGLTPLTVISVAFLVIIGLPLFGALRDPRR